MSYSANSGLAGFQSWSATKAEARNINNRAVSNKYGNDKFSHIYGVHHGLPSAPTVAAPPLESIHTRILQAKLQNTMLKQRVISEVIKSNNSTNINSSISESTANESELLIRINKLEEQLKKVTSFTPGPITNNENITNTESKRQVETSRKDMNSSRKDAKNASLKPVNSARDKNAASMAKAATLFKPFSKKKSEEIEESDDLHDKADDISLEASVHKTFDKKVSNNLSILADDVAVFMKQNTFNDNKLTNEEQLLAEERENNKSNFRNIVKRNTTLYKMPKWRHVSLGNANPEPALVLKGKRLFHVIAWGIIVLFIRPSLAAHKRRLSSKRKEKSDLMKAIFLYMDLWDSLLAKISKQSLASIFTDKQLDFNLNLSNSRKLNERVMQLKVRIKGIVAGIVASPALPSNMLDFLVTFTESGNYYPRKFLYTYESANLLFDKYGATTEMLQHVDSMVNKNTILVDKHTFLDASKVKSVILSFILIKVLINHIMLSPWIVGVCGIPNNRKMVYNFRVIASVMYDIVRLIDPIIPPIAPKGSAVSAADGANAVEDEDGENDEVSKIVDLEKVKSKSKTDFDEDKKDESIKNFFSSLVGIKSTGGNDEDERQATNALIATRPKYSTLEELHSYLLPPSNFVQAKALLDPWMAEYAGLLGKWVTGIVQNVLEYRQQKIEELYNVDEDHLTEQVLTGRVHGSVTNRKSQKSDDKLMIPRLNLPG